MKSSLCLLLSCLLHLFSTVTGHVTSIPFQSVTQGGIKKRLRRRAVCPLKQIPIAAGGSSSPPTNIKSHTSSAGIKVPTSSRTIAQSVTPSPTVVPSETVNAGTSNNQPKLSSKKGFGFTQPNQLAAFGNSLGWAFKWLSQSCWNRTKRYNL